MAAKSSRFGVEVGYTGLKQYGGRINEEFLRQLHGRKAAKVFTEMSENDSTVGAILFAIEMLLRNVKWTVEPFSDDLEHKEQAEFVESNLYDMSSSWENTITEILSFLTFGWSSPFIVYKRRDGPLQKDPSRRSKHSDGRIGWRKLAPRSQDTLDRWEFDDDGGVDGWHQTQDFAVGPHKATEFLPIDRLLIFRSTSYKGNPEGKSVIRRAYVSWYYKKRAQEAEAIGIERDLAGMPLIYAPEDLFDANPSDEAVTALAEYKNIIENIRNDEQMGLCLPASFDEHGNRLVEFSLVGTGATRLFDTNAIINRYKQEIAMTVLADFILLGHEKVGSFALASSKTELFATALGAWLQEIESVFNRHGIPRLYVLNGWDPSETASLKAGDIEKIDLEAFAAAYGGLVSAGGLTPGLPEDEEHIRSKVMGLPEKISDSEFADDDQQMALDLEPEVNVEDVEI